jgi:hypothetical protein
MPSLKLTQLPAAASVVAADLVYVVTDVAGTPTSNKALVSVLATAVGTLSFPDFVDTAGVILTATVPLLVNESSATAFQVGPNGATDPTFKIVTNTASGVSGVSITNTIGGPTIAAIDNGAAANLILSAKGAGYVASAMNLNPSANDGAALGTTALGWSDLHLASGGVINWANGGFTVTHSSNTTDSGGQLSGQTADLGISRNAAGVLEVNNGTAGTYRDALARQLFAAGDNAGLASTTSLTNTTSATVTNAYVVAGGQAATTQNSGWLKLYSGVTVIWVPFWANATP